MVMNEYQKKRFAKKVVDTLFNTITGKVCLLVFFLNSFIIVFRQRIAVLGFAFKADTGDTRESAAISLIRDFQDEKALVSLYDPQVPHEQIWADLSEASPHLPLQQSMFFSPFYIIQIDETLRIQSKSKLRYAIQLSRRARMRRQSLLRLNGRSSRK